MARRKLLVLWSSWEEEIVLDTLGVVCVCAILDFNYVNAKIASKLQKPVHCF